jgi:hypothetical protein
MIVLDTATSPWELVHDEPRPPLVVVVLEEDELLLEDEELEELELEELLEDELELLDELEPPPEPLGIEHSLTPPATRVPAPKVASLQTKLPLRTLKVNRSARPKATLVLAATVHVLNSLQIVT